MCCIDVNEMVAGKKSWICVYPFSLPSGRSCFLQCLKIVRGCSWVQLHQIKPKWTFLQEKEAASKFGRKEVCAIYVAKDPCNPLKEKIMVQRVYNTCLLYTSDAADD